MSTQNPPTKKKALLQFTRPQPSKELLDIPFPAFAPASDFPWWVEQTFLNESSPLFNVEHQHLTEAKIGFLWATAANARSGRQVVGRASPGKVQRASRGKWEVAREEFQLYQWFGDEQPLDFVITLSAPYCLEANDATFCALVEHEMYHCGQKLDEFMQPMFAKKTGKPLYAMRGHDVEEFTGIVRRYGVEAAAAGTLDIVAAAGYKPELAIARISELCGSCG